MQLVSEPIVLALGHEDEVGADEDQEHEERNEGLLHCAETSRVTRRTQLAIAAIAILVGLCSTAQLARPHDLDPEIVGEILAGLPEQIVERRPALPSVCGQEGFSFFFTGTTPTVHVEVACGQRLNVDGPFEVLESCPMAVGYNESMTRVRSEGSPFKQALWDCLPVPEPAHGALFGVAWLAVLRARNGSATLCRSERYHSPRT